MKMDVYFFSGTGNSLYIAKNLTQKAKGRIIPIASVIKKESITPKADIICIVFPVYYADIPLIIKRFVEKLINIENKYIFAVSNYGGSTGDSFKRLNRLIKSKGGELSAAFGIHMPQNAFRKPWENYNKIYRKCRKKIDFIIRKVENRVKGIYHSNVILEWLTSPFVGLVKSMTKKSLVKETNSSMNLGLDEVMLLMDKTFHINDNCNSCGICSKVCPVNNINMEDNKPVWQNNCENCLACYNWCPKKAIEGGVAQKGYHYLNSEITVSEIINQNRID